MKAAAPPDFPPIFVVSLARAKERREKMRERLNALGLQYEIIDAVDGATLNPAEYAHNLRQEKFRRKFGREMTPGEIGCYLSHYRLWERIVAEQISCALVLEDDAFPGDDFAAVVADVVLLDFRWDVVHLAAHRPELVEVAFRGLAGRGYVFGRFKRRLVWAHAYLINLAGAKKLLNICREISEPIDHAWGHWWWTGLAFHCVAPELARQAGANSTIGGNRNPNAGKAADRIIGAIWRRWDRISCLLCRLTRPLPKGKWSGE